MTRPVRARYWSLGQGAGLPLAVASPRIRPPGRWRSSRPARTPGSCAASSLSCDHLAQERRRARGCRRSRVTPGAGTSTRIRRGNPAFAGPAKEGRRWHWDWRPSGGRPWAPNSANSARRRALRVEQFLGPVAAQPGLQLRQVRGIGRRVGKRHLMGAESALDRLAVHHLGPGPALGGVEHDHRPARPLGPPVRAGVLLDRADLLHRARREPPPSPRASARVRGLRRNTGLQP